MITATSSGERLLTATDGRLGNAVGSGKTLALVYKALHMATENSGCVGLLGVPIQAMLETLKRTASLSSSTARWARSC